jgi:RimJ/RimL family protein N-acetyltransferase
MIPPVTISSARITLKELNPAFLKEYHKNFSPTVRKILHLPPKAKFKETEDYLTSRLLNNREENTLFYCIFCNKTKKFIGALEIRDKYFPKGQLGAWLNEKYWGKGFYQEAVCLALKVYSQMTRAKKINARIDVNNIRSLKAHQKMGFKITKEFTIKGTKTCCEGLRVYELTLDLKNIR